MIVTNLWGICFSFFAPLLALIYLSYKEAEETQIKRVAQRQTTVLKLGG